MIAGLPDDDDDPIADVTFFQNQIVAEVQKGELLQERRRLKVELWRRRRQFQPTAAAAPHDGGAARRYPETAGGTSLGAPSSTFGRRSGHACVAPVGWHSHGDIGRRREDAAVTSLA